MVVANFDAQTPCRLYQQQSAAKFSKKESETYII